MTHVVQAGAEEFIWIVVGVFWVIAQIAGGAAKKKMAPPRPVTDEDGEQEEPPALSNVEGFADLMRKLSGVQEIKIPQPPKPQWVEKPPAPVSEVLPTPTPSSKASPVEEVAEVDIRPTMNSFKAAMPAMKLPSMKMSYEIMDEPGNQQLLEVCIKAAKAAGAHALNNLHRREEVIESFDHDVKLVMDRECQTIAEGIVHGHFPDHAILGEEGVIEKEHAIEWVIDPIDGTANYTRGFPYWACSVAVRRDEKVLAGCIFVPVLNECYSATIDGPALCNDRGRNTRSEKMHLLCWAHQRHRSARHRLLR